MTGGYTGDGFKTVIPAVASAKISFRLVFDQDPHKIRAAFREFVKARIPADCRVEFTEFGSGRAVAFEVSRPGLPEHAKGAERRMGQGGGLRRRRRVDPGHHDDQGKAGDGRGDGGLRPVATTASTARTRSTA